MGMHRAPVCAENGFTIINECVALCQGLAVVRPGPCTAGSAGNVVGTAAADNDAGDAAAYFLSPRHVATGARVGMAVASKYKKQGFTYIGRVKLASSKARTPTVASSDAATAAVAG